jgi:hypothetical protein
MPSTFSTDLLTVFRTFYAIRTCFEYLRRDFTFFIPFRPIYLVYRSVAERSVDKIKHKIEIFK